MSHYGPNDLGPSYTYVVILVSTLKGIVAI